MTVCVCTYCKTAYTKGKNSYGLYCSNQCQASHKQRVAYDSWCNGTPAETSTRTLGNMLRKFEGNACSMCGITEWAGNPLKMQLDHINGNHTDNRKENCCLVCPNCDAQSSTYKGKNRGSGRFSRRERYAAGKSF